MADGASRFMSLLAFLSCLSGECFRKVIPKKERKKKDGSFCSRLRRCFRRSVDRVRNRNKVACDQEKRKPKVSLEKKYKIIRMLGQGSHASGVYMAEELAKERLVAIKTLEISTTRVEQIKKEVTIMRIVKHHPNIVTYITSHINHLEKRFWIVMECIPGVRLGDIEKNRTKEGHIAAVARECLQGIQYIHEKNVIHRSLHSGNILLGLDGSVKIVDFGNSVLLEGDMRNEFTKKTDMMRFGRSISEMYDSEIPFSSLLLVLEKRRSRTLKASLEFQDFLSKCLADNVYRPSASELLQFSPAPVFKISRKIQPKFKISAPSVQNKKQGKQ